MHLLTQYKFYYKFLLYILLSYNKRIENKIVINYIRHSLYLRSLLILLLTRNVYLYESMKNQ